MIEMSGESKKLCGSAGKTGVIIAIVSFIAAFQTARFGSGNEKIPSILPPRPFQPCPLPHVGAEARSAQKASLPSPRQIGLAHSDGSGLPCAEGVCAAVPLRAETAMRLEGDDRTVIVSGSGTFKGGNVHCKSC